MDIKAKIGLDVKTESTFSLSGVVLEEDLQTILNNADQAKNPAVVFDDDGDGVCSFLQLHKFLEMRGIDLKKWATLRTKRPVIKDKLSELISENHVDSLFVLDIVGAKERFFSDLNGTKITWIDHHAMCDDNRDLPERKLNYINPSLRRLTKEVPYFPTSAICYEAWRQDAWIAAIGYLSDGALPMALLDLFHEYSYLLKDKSGNNYGYIESEFNLKLIIAKNKFQRPSEKTTSLLKFIREETLMGDLINIFNYVLKGTDSDVKKNIELLTKISIPHEILDERLRSEPGKALFDYYEKTKADYQETYNKIINNLQSSVKVRENTLYYAISQGKYDFMTQIATKLILENPKKIILVSNEEIAKTEDAFVELSLRANNFDLNEAIMTIKHKFLNLYPYEFDQKENKYILTGGGHPMASGLSIKKKYLGEFMHYFLELAK